MLNWRWNSWKIARMKALPARKCYLFEPIPKIWNSSGITQPYIATHKAVDHEDHDKLLVKKINILVQRDIWVPKFHSWIFEISTFCNVYKLSSVLEVVMGVSITLIGKVGCFFEGLSQNPQTILSETLIPTIAIIKPLDIQIAFQENTFQKKEESKVTHCLKCIWHNNFYFFLWKGIKI